MPREFTSDWVTSRIPLWTRLTKDFAGRAGLSALEIGCWEGRSTCWWLENVLTHSTSSLICIDPWGGAPGQERYERFCRNLADTKRENQVAVIRGRSHQVVPRFSEESFDLIYVDGSHEARDVLLDGLLCLRRLRPGGLMIFDDYRWPGNPAWPSEVLPDVGIDAFLAVNPKLRIVEKGYQVAVRLG